MLCSDITELIGGTPLLRLDPDRHRIPGVELYAKLEFLNPFGSVKDRIAWAMAGPYLPGIARRGQMLIEASSGNTAKALQVLASMHGTRLRALTNRAKVPEIRDVLEFLGADLQELPGLSECPDPTVPDDVFSVIDRHMAEQQGEFHHASQYTNPDNVAAHEATTGREIYDDAGPVDYLFGGLGTTGSTRGAATFLLGKNPALQTIGIVSTRDDFIPGIRSESEMWEVGIFERDFYTDIVPVSSADAIDGTLELARQHGVLAGPTTGAAYTAARRYLTQAGAAAGRPPLRAVFFACDRLEPYVSYLRKRRPDLFGHDGAVTGPVAVAPGDGGPEVTVAELAAREPGSSVLCIDTRGSMAYRAGHIPGSVNISDDQLEDMLRHGVPFPAGLTVILICPAGEYSRALAGTLARAGVDAASLAGGVVAWRDAGLPLEPSPRYSSAT